MKMQLHQDPLPPPTKITFLCRFEMHNDISRYSREINSTKCTVTINCGNVICNCLYLRCNFKNLLQPTSSLPSAQVGMPLHWELAEMHCPFEHLNWLAVQLVLSAIRKLQCYNYASWHLCWYNKSSKSRCDIKSAHT